MLSGRYREYAPHPALQGRVRAFFTFGPDAASPAPFEAGPAHVDRPLTYEARVDGAGRPPSFADAGASIVFELPWTCTAGGIWTSVDRSPEAWMIGAMTHVAAQVRSDLPAMVGAYLHPAEASRFAARELPETCAIDVLESELLRRALGPATPADGKTAVRVGELAACALQRGGQVTVEELARAAGVSRQHLTRVFHERIGVGPKLFCRLARFQTALGYARESTVRWSQAAAALGYADQSHMIAELREFSGFTPERLARGLVFHPFVARPRGASAPELSWAEGGSHRPDRRR